MPVLLLFVDGVGIGADDPSINPFAAAPPRHLRSLIDERRATLAPLDANLDVPGLPQSGTGQYSIFTGDNGAQRFGRHFGPWVPTALREPLRTDNLLTRARHDGHRIAFANAYPAQLIDAAHVTGTFKAVGPLRSALPLAAWGAGALNRHLDALRAGEAVSSEITNRGWRQHVGDVEEITAAEAGGNLARIANRHDLTLFAHFQTDTAGHTKDMQAAVDALTLFDDFLGGVVAEFDPEGTLLVFSDHGNLEDIRGGHTRNPALGLVAGPAHADQAACLGSLLDIAPVAAAMLAAGSATAPRTHSRPSSPK